MQSNTPTQPEVQPRLDIEHDPIFSPDAADNTPTAAPKQIVKQGNTGVYTLRQNVDEVLLHCAVIDSTGQNVNDLKQGDFKVWEDSAPQTILSFLHRDLPASIGILIDNSGSMLDKRAAVNAAALSLLKASNPKDTAFVVNFSDKAYLDAGFTSDTAVLQKGLSHVDTRGTTALYDAVSASANELTKYAQWPEQVLVIVTDGRDNASMLTLRQAVERVQQLGGPVVYTIGLLYENPNKAAVAQARGDLEALSEETGGIAYFPKSLDEVEGIAESVAQDIRNQYVIGYHPENLDNSPGFRTVRVEAQVPKRGRLIVRTRHGYFPRQVKQDAKSESAQTSGTAPATPAPATPAPAGK